MARFCHYYWGYTLMSLITDRLVTASGQSNPVNGRDLEEGSSHNSLEDPNEPPKIIVASSCELVCTSNSPIQWILDPPGIYQDKIPIRTRVSVSSDRGSPLFRISLQLRNVSAFTKLSTRCQERGHEKQRTEWYRVEPWFPTVPLSNREGAKEPPPLGSCNVCRVINNTIEDKEGARMQFKPIYCKIWSDCELLLQQQTQEIYRVGTGDCDVYPLGCGRLRELSQLAAELDKEILRGMFLVGDSKTSELYAVPYPGEELSTAAYPNLVVNHLERVGIFSLPDTNSSNLTVSCFADPFSFSCGMKLFINGKPWNVSEYVCDRVNIQRGTTVLDRATLTTSSINVTCWTFCEFSSRWTKQSSLVQLTNKENYSTTFGGTALTGMAIGGGVCLLVLFPCLVLLVKKLRHQQETIRMTHEEIYDFVEGIQAERVKGKHAVFLLPYDKQLEIPEREIEMRSSVLGSGAFGKVLKGRYRGREVAVKTVSNFSDGSYFRSLLGELKVMSYLGRHEFLVELIGAMTGRIRTGEVYLIFECCVNGNALNYIRNQRDGFVNQLSRDLTSFDRPILRDSSDGDLHDTRLRSRDLLRWSYQVAAGMEYVSSRNIYHGDLAARNILLTADLVAKISDFGLSKQLDVESYSTYIQKQECPLPLKWLAIECLRDLKFSIQSDVWSFGVTLWEFFSLGTIPYPGMDWNFESWKFLCDGGRLGRPFYASLPLYALMQQCWEENPKKRPTFARLKQQLWEIQEIH